MLAIACPQSLAAAATYADSGFRLWGLSFWTWVVLLVVLVILSILAVLLFATDHGESVRAVRWRRATRIADARVGDTVKVVGRLVCAGGAPLVGPVSGRPCLLYGCKPRQTLARCGGEVAEYAEQLGQRAAGECHASVWLADASGRVLIEGLDEARVSISQDALFSDGSVVEGRLQEGDVVAAVGRCALSGDGRHHVLRAPRGSRVVVANEVNPRWVVKDAVVLTGRTTRAVDVKEDSSMSGALSHKLVFGPFAAAYHRDAVDDLFRSRLSRFVEEQLLPLSTLCRPEVSGAVTAFADEDRHCGPNSAVKEIYRLQITLADGKLTEDFDQEIIHRPEAETFTVRGDRPLYLWTVERKRRQVENEKAIEALISKICNGLREAQCPVCGAPVDVSDEAEIFGAKCSEGCFYWHYHRFELGGEPVHGTFMMKDPP